MRMVITDAGKVEALFSALCAVDTALFEDWWIELFKSNTTVTSASVLSDFTLADFAGYLRVSQTRAQFHGAAITGTVARTGNLNSVSFSSTDGAGQLVYGWIMVGKVSGDVFAGQNFDLPRNMNSGAVESLDPFNFDLATLCLCAE